MPRLLLKGARLLDPGLGLEAALDLRVEDGRIAELGKGLAGRTGEEVISLEGAVLVPGFIDLHVHLREPGYEYRETVASGTRAAARGGFTAVACMPNTRPPLDTPAALGYVRRRAEEGGVVRVWPVCAITRGLAGQELADLGLLRRAGAVACSDDGRPVMNAHLMRRALEYAAALGLTVISHCEDEDLSAGGAMNEGTVSLALGLKGIPPEAETVMVARDLELAAATGGRLHVAHVSTARSVELIRQARRRGVPVTAEVTPHHFTLTEEAVRGYNTSAKVNPPLRTQADVNAVLEGLADGTIDVIATDHAPYSWEEKEQEFAAAPFGLVGLETAVSLVLDRLVHGGVLTLAEAIARLAINPARVLGLEPGRLEVGAPAYLTAVDPDRPVTVEAARFASKGRNTPFEGWKLRGMAVLTVVGGRVIMRDGELVV